MSYTINCTGENPYSRQINQFLYRTFPRSSRIESTDLIDILTDVLLGTKQTRNGPKPGPESLVLIRDVLRKWTARNHPIPMMVPWGSEKPDGSGVDIAEAMALRMMSTLNEEVKAFYPPGIIYRVRVEDASAPYLFYEDKARASCEAKRYTEGFQDLVYRLELNDFIHIVPESLFVDEDEFERAAENHYEDMREALFAYAEGDDQTALNILNGIGWSGGIAYSTRMHYLTSYKKLYPDKSNDQHLEILARYFVSALTRRKLGIRGDLPEWENSFIDLSFVSPIPGTEGYFNRRLNYRTVPLSMTSQHMPPWRSKGYLQINNDNEVCAKLASYHDLPDDLIPNIMEIERGGLSALQADYRIA